MSYLVWYYGLLLSLLCGLPGAYDLNNRYLVILIKTKTHDSRRLVRFFVSLTVLFLA
ncbi:hypothetical protein Plhal304r1_c025g0084571 [Plasmopara halstedii]